MRLDKPIWLNIFTQPHVSNLSVSISPTHGNAITSTDSKVKGLSDINSWYRDKSLEGLKYSDLVKSTTNATQFSVLRSWKSISFLNTDVNAAPISLKEYFFLNCDKSSISDHHRKKIDELWLQVRNHGKMKYLTHLEGQKVKDALTIAYIALWGKKTLRSLEVSINRARGIAAALGDMKADLDVVLAGILHDVHGEFTASKEFEMIQKLTDVFGAEVMTMAGKYSALPKFMAKKAVYTPMQSEYQVQMLVALVEDYRSLYIRLADRLHTLRVLRSLPLNEKEQSKIAQEALSVYAPLAHKMGCMKVKGELEDLAFRVLDPKMFQQTKYTQTAANKAYHEAADMIQDIISKDSYLIEQNANFRMTYRIKDKYQINLKLKRKNLSSLNDVRDALGLRLIVEVKPVKGELEDDRRRRGERVCYHVVDSLRKMSGWVPSADGFKDYIVGRKENGYQSLHQYVKNIATGTQIEVQVRTKDMHVQAELGEAAHWHYKDLIYRKDVANSKSYRLAWRSSQQLNANSAAELIGMAKKQLQANRVFVFLDDMSTVLSLRKGSTALDAAFSIHSDIGLSAKAISLDGAPVPLSTPLKNGDVVSVQTAAAPIAKTSWLHIVKASGSLATIRKYFRDNHRLMIICLGLGQLLATYAINLDLIKKRYESDLPSASKVSRYAQSRIGLTIDSFLCALGTATGDTIRISIARLLDLPPSEVKTVSMSLALDFCKKESLKGFLANDFQSLLLVPFLEMLGLPVERKWCELLNIRSATNLIRMPTENVPEEFPGENTEEKLFSGYRLPKIYAKSPIIIARTPYSLEAPSLTPSLLRFAKHSFAEKVKANANNKHMIM